MSQNDLTGIQNENEFYSEHYLTSVFDARQKTDGTADEKDLRQAAQTYARTIETYRETRDGGERLRLFRALAQPLLTALGFERDPHIAAAADETGVPVLARARDAEGAERLWILETLSPHGEDFPTDPLALTADHVTPTADDPAVPEGESVQTLVTRRVFGMEEPPRFVVVVSMAQVVLIDRFKWADSRVLRFHLDDILTRKATTGLRLLGTFLSASALVPEGGQTSLVDRIDQESQRHARGVSEDLKYALRDAIEVLGNEAADRIADKRGQQKTAIYTGANAIDPDQLTRECLRFMYRLLFLFYIEARPELGYAPFKSEAYRKGYSLESLRELELVPLQTEEERAGTYLDRSLRLLFGFIHEGTPNLDPRDAAAGNDDTDAENRYGDFMIRPVQARLFDPGMTPLLSEVSFSNATLQQVIRLMSLSAGDRKKGRGRISYAQLGVNQLGAVYEALLSYTGFFASEDLYEVKPADESNQRDPLKPAFFVGASSVQDYSQDEIVYAHPDGDPNQPRQPVVYPKGTFIYRLTGAERSETASYYTPEPLTRLLVKHTLELRTQGLEADDLLDLTICEPAMGSAAFLVETVNQLTDMYLRMKQAELGEAIPHEDYARERQKVRAHITDRNVFGVDRNPVARELGEVSLWLNCIHDTDFVPWFGDQLHAGDSLIGARATVFPTSALTAKKKTDRWPELTPRDLKGAERREGEVYSFLLPFPGMAAYETKAVGDIAPQALETIKTWRKGMLAAFTRDEVRMLEKLSGAIDELLAQYAHDLANERVRSNDVLSIYGHRATETRRSHATKDTDLQRMKRGESSNAPAYLRLKTAMDYWCALWAWPLEAADQLPSRSDFLMEMSLILEGHVQSSGADLFQSEAVLREESAKQDIFSPKRQGFVSIDELHRKLDRLKVVEAVRQRLTPFHWDLEFADMLRERGGFDVIAGNPPWVPIKWNNATELGRHIPAFEIRDLSADKAHSKRADALAEPSVREGYARSHEVNAGQRSFLSSVVSYPLAARVQTNLYKNFIDLSFRLLAAGGRIGLLHEDGHFTDPKGGSFRMLIYYRLYRHFHFRNEKQKYMFPGIGGTRQYSVNIYGPPRENIHFYTGHNFFLPQTVDACFAHDGEGPVPGIKDENNNWEIRGHRDRILEVDETALEAFHRLLEGGGEQDILQTRMPSPHSKGVVEILRRFAQHGRTLGSEVADWKSRRLWDETEDRKRGIVKNKEGFRNNLIECVFKGPIFHIGNPFQKSADRFCKTKQAYSLTDPLFIEDDFAPRTPFTIGVSEDQYRSALPSVPWDPTRKHTDFFRFAVRRMTQPGAERTLIGSLIPPEVAHVHTVESVAFADGRNLLNASALWSSIPIDFVAKASGVSEIWESVLRNLPWCDLPQRALMTYLRLVCLTTHYAPLWGRNVEPSAFEPWAIADPRLNQEAMPDPPAQWRRDVALRTDFARRQALIEIDVLTAMAFGFSCADLEEMYCVQFPTMQHYEHNTYYDARGQIVWTNNAGGLPRVGYLTEDGKRPAKAEWERRYAGMQAGETLTCEIEDDTLPGGPHRYTKVFEAPFETRDRVTDYRRTWAALEAAYAPAPASAA